MREHSFSIYQTFFLFSFLKPTMFVLWFEFSAGFDHCSHNKKHWGKTSLMHLFAWFSALCLHVSLCVPFPPTLASLRWWSTGLTMSVNLSVADSFTTHALHWWVPSLTKRSPSHSHWNQKMNERVSGTNGRKGTRTKIYIHIKKRLSLPEEKKRAFYLTFISEPIALFF